MEDNSMNGKYLKSTKKTNVDEQKTYQWVRKTVLKAETEEDLLILDQDQSFETRCYHCNKIKYSEMKDRREIR